MAENQDKPKIIVDDDWKAEAQREKEHLAAEEQAKSTPPAEQGADELDAAEGQDPHGQLPQANFPTLINSLGVQAMMALGGVEDPQTKRRVVDLGMAKFLIDMLGMIQEKTKGNLADDEKQMLEQILYELRMAYVQFTQQAAEHFRQQQEKKEQ